MDAASVMPTTEVVVDRNNKKFPKQEKQPCSCHVINHGMNIMQSKSSSTELRRSLHISESHFVSLPANDTPANKSVRVDSLALHPFSSDSSLIP